MMLKNEGKVVKKGVKNVKDNILPHSRKVVHGLSGWSDSSLVRCKRYFPPLTSQSSTTEKLHFMSRRGGLGCVEVNSSTYAIPSSTTVESWVSATSDTFVFHFKAFGIFCASKVSGKSLPHYIRSQYNLKSDRSYTLTSLPSEVQVDLWTAFNNCLSPAVAANKMGVVLFQFHLNFLPSESNMKFVESCAKHLRQDVKMAVEFRNRSWHFADDRKDGGLGLLSFDCIGRLLNFDEPDRLEKTCSWLKSLRSDERIGGVALVACEDMYREVYPNGAGQGSASSLPTVLTSHCCCDFAYIRVHRREGKHRVLKHNEIQRWAAAIVSLMEETSDEANSCDSADSIFSLRGPCYVLWGTDFEDHPILNMRHLNAEIPATYRLECMSQHSSINSRKGNPITSMFAKKGEQKCRRQSGSII